MSNCLHRCAVLLLLLASCSACADIVVDTATDEDASNSSCSLREAIMAVNAQANHNGCVDGDATQTWSKITFAIAPNAGEVETITLGTALPAIVRPVFIDATTQSGAICTPVPNLRVQITNPLSLSAAAIKLDTGSDASTIRGLAISGFDGSGSAIWIISNHATIGCVIAGMDASGTTAQPNGYGVSIGDGATGGQFATIGEATATTWFPNLISANSVANIQVSSGADNALIAGNYIGVDHTGLSAQPGGDAIMLLANNGHIGSGFDGGPALHQRNIIGAAVASASGTVHELVIGPVANTIVAGNYIGVGVDGHTVLPIGIGGGIDIIDGATNTLIGCNGIGSWDDCRNIIVAPSTNGAGLTAISNLSAGTAIVSNFINVAADGTTSLADPQYGNTFGIEFSYDTLVARNVIAAGIGLSIGLLSPGAGSNAGFLNPGVAGSGGASLMSADNCVIDVTSSGVTIESGTHAATTFANNYWGASDGPRPSGSGASADALIGFVPFEAVKSVYCGYDQIFGSDFGG